MDYRAELMLLVYNRDRSAHLRGSMEVVLPFVPTVGMHIQYRDMRPLVLKKVVWSTDHQSFQCIVEDDMCYDFALEDSVDELTDLLDVLRDTRAYGWRGLEKIFRDI